MTLADQEHVLAQVGEAGVYFTQAAIGMAIVGLDGRFLRVNPALCELTGRGERELLGMTWQAVTHPDDVSPGEREVGRALEGEERTFRLAKRYIRPDGDLVWALLSVSLIRGHQGDPLCLFTQAVDISEQRQADEGLAQLAAIVESSDDAILSKALDGTILTWNRAAERMYGYAATEIVGKNVITIVPPHLRGELRGLLDSAASGRSIANHETVRMRKDKSLIDVSITISPIRNAAGEVVRASTIARDITEQKRMVEKLDVTLTALEAALADAREAEARSRRLLSDAAHHLRNPIAGMRSCAETVLRGCSEPERERLLGVLAQETSRASRLVDRLLRISRLTHGERLLLEQVDIVEICRLAVERANSVAPNLLIAIEGDDSLLVDGDVGAVTEIVANLLDNAVRYAAGRIDVTATRHDASAYIAVRDDGFGLKEETLDRVFEPFVSLDGSGPGLGLSLSRALARAQGGTLSYDGGAFVLKLRASDRASVPE